MDNRNGQQSDAEQFDWFDDDLQDLEEDAEAAQVQLIQPRFTAAELLDRLIHDPELVTGRDLFAFSDLSRSDAASVRENWTAIPIERRRAVVSNMVDLAENNLSWQLGRILRIALEDEDAQVRRLAIQGLWEDAESDLLGPLVDTLRRDEDDDVRAAAATALGNYVLAGELDELDAALAMRVEQALLEVLRNEDESAQLRGRALEGIAYSGEMGVRELIEEAYYSPLEVLRVSALVAMGRSADVHWRSYARAELQNPSVAMRAEAARACGELEARQAVDDLILLLGDDEQAVRVAAIFALGRIGGQAAREALHVVSAESDSLEAEAAEDALEEILFNADQQTVDAFDDAEEDDEWDGDIWPRDDDDDLGEYEV